VAAIAWRLIVGKKLLLLVAKACDASHAAAIMNQNAGSQQVKIGRSGKIAAAEERAAPVRTDSRRKCYDAANRKIYRSAVIFTACAGAEPDGEPHRPLVTNHMCWHAVCG